MTKKITLITALFTVLATIFLLSSCSQWETPYDRKDREGYTVSVRFDANGGAFGSIEGETYMVDVFRLQDGADTADGKKAFTLFAPDDALRGNNNAFTVSRANHLLAGWYTREETGTDADGNPTYEYTKWDFENDRLTLDGNGDYTGSESVLTLYAMWIPEFTFEIYAKNASGVFEKINEITKTTLRLPTWKDGKAKIDMNGFPERTGYTFLAAYTDEAMQNKVTAESITGDVEATLDGSGDRTVKLYTEWYEGKYIKVFSAKDFKDNAAFDAHFYLQNDIDFSKVAWPSNFTTGEFKGKIIGNGHAIKNVTATQTDAKKRVGGIFGEIADTAVMTDVRFENLTYTLKVGSLHEATFGLFAGNIEDGATLTGVSVSGTLVIGASISQTMLQTVYLLSGDGDSHGIDLSGITCRAAETAPFTVTVDPVTHKVTLTTASDDE